jgi:hypothetical protein
MPERLQPPPNRLRILQINLNKSEKAHLDLLNGPLGTKWDVVLLQEPHVTKFNTIRTPMRFRQVYPADRWKEGAIVRSAIWVNTEIDTKSWKIIKIPDTNNITVIQINGPYGVLTIFNIYNSCTHSQMEAVFRRFLRDNADTTWRRNDTCSDYPDT